MPLRCLLTLSYPASERREAELHECLEKNLHLAQLDKIILFTEGEKRPPINSDKLLIVPYEGPRITYGYLLNWAEQNLAPGDLVIIANSDIFFDATLALADKHIKSDPPVALALSRWDVQKQGVATLFERDDSQDSWFFKLPLSLSPQVRTNLLSIPLGLLGCDNRVAYELAVLSGYQLHNYARTIHSYHLHLSAERSWSEATCLRGGYHLIEPQAIPRPLGVDRIIYYNLPTRIDRKQALEYLLLYKWGVPREQIIRIPGLQHSQGQIGCKLAHLSGLKRARDLQWPSVLFLEDDYDSELSREELDFWLAEGEKVGYDAFLLTANQAKVELLPNTSLLLRVKACVSAAAYVIRSPTLRDELIEVMEASLPAHLAHSGSGYSYAYDVLWWSLQSKYKWLTANKRLGGQRASYSDIEGRVTSTQ